MNITLGEICNTLPGVPAPKYGGEVSMERRGLNNIPMPLYCLCIQRQPILTNFAMLYHADLEFRVRAWDGHEFGFDLIAGMCQFQAHGPQ